jgi:hypothetical protein
MVRSFSPGKAFLSCVIRRNDWIQLFSFTGTSKTAEDSRRTDGQLEQKISSEKNFNVVRL